MRQWLTTAGVLAFGAALAAGCSSSVGTGGQPDAGQPDAGDSNCTGEPTCAGCCGGASTPASCSGGVYSCPEIVCGCVDSGSGDTGSVDASACVGPSTCAGCCGGPPTPASCSGGVYSCPVIECAVCDAGPGDSGGDGAACGHAALEAFATANDTCTTSTDCVPLCTLGATCDIESVNKAGAAAFPSTFAGCVFDQCAIACFPGTCTGGKCN